MTAPSPKDVTIAIIGSGLVGQGWAISFARGGCNVRLWDNDPEAPKRAVAGIPAALKELADNDLLDEDAAVVAGRIAAVGSIEAALDGAGHVQENAPEDVEIKKQVTNRIATIAGPETVIASSTSSLMPSLFTEQAPGRDRCVVGHPLNPPYLTPAVEIVPAPWTAPSTVEKARALYAAIGHSPIVLEREVDGFVVNRLQGALLHEAFRLVADGYAKAEDIDRAVRDGLGLRWSFMGPFETIDLNAPGGICDYVARYEGMYQRSAEQQKETRDWIPALEAGIEAERAAALPRNAIAERQAWRDRRLTALAAHRKAAERDIGR
jgi:3-hydroxyacyl-CoA dehydrogenase